jgi:hypothetical protein
VTHVTAVSRGLDARGWVRDGEWAHSGPMTGESNRIRPIVCGDVHGVKYHATRIGKARVRSVVNTGALGALQ